MSEEFSRTRLLFGEEKMKKIAASRVAVFGIGGVGGYVVEGLVRSGVTATGSACPISIGRSSRLTPLWANTR